MLDGVAPLRLESVKRLIVVPDGALSQLPFEALPFDGKPLIERFEVSYLPAASLLRNPTGRSWLLPWQRSVVAFGDPVATDRAGGVIPGDERWLRLPRSGDEAKWVADRMPGRSRVYVGAQARKQTFLDEAPRYPVLHLATHAVNDPENTAGSRILFSGDEGYEYLFLNETLSLDLRAADLVTLSACETERGRRIRAEGAQSFSRAFLAAGARSTIASLWPVSDHAAAEFMKQFYGALRGGETKAGALRSAKLRFLASGTELAEPRYWAAFVLNGDGGEPVRPLLSWWQLMAGLGMMVGAAGWWLASLTRRARMG
jgi:CHAT domain-containing protein